MVDFPYASPPIDFRIYLKGTFMNRFLQTSYFLSFNHPELKHFNWICFRWSVKLFIQTLFPANYFCWTAAFRNQWLKPRNSNFFALFLMEVPLSISSIIYFSTTTKILDLRCSNYIYNDTSGRSVSHYKNSSSSLFLGHILWFIK